MGEEPQFVMVVKNLGDKRRAGTILLIWDTNNAIVVPRPIQVDLEPGEGSEYDIPTEWLCFPGSALYRWGLIGEPESVVLPITFEMVKQAMWYSFHTLCSYAVKDRAVYEDEKKRHEAVLGTILRGPRKPVLPNK